jgi:hypothetical protein
MMGSFGTVYVSARRGMWRMCLVSLLCATSAALGWGQERDAQVTRRPAGFFLGYGVSMVKPVLSDEANAPFAEIGSIRGGPGVWIEGGYSRGRWDFTASAEYAGLDVGDVTVSNGLAMGRESLILRGSSVSATFRPETFILKGWQAGIGLGLAKARFDNLEIQADQLPATLRDTAIALTGGEGVQQLAISGSGFRLAFEADRRVSPGMAVRLGLVSDLVEFKNLSLEDSLLPWSGGQGWIPRFTARARWFP